MSELTVWVVLTDGRYTRVLINKSADSTLLTLKADDSEALADLCYQVVRGMKPGAKDGTKSREQSNMQLLAGFLYGQLQEQQYDKLILAAPASKLEELRNELNDAVLNVIAGELSKDMLALSVDEIEEQLADLIQEARR